jgi:hypothetical protein
MHPCFDLARIKTLSIMGGIDLGGAGRSTCAPGVGEQ